MVDCQVSFEEATLYTLAGPELMAVLDGMSRGIEFPIAIVGDEIACSGVLDPVAVSGVIRRRARM